MPWELVIFDLDGTLLDTLEDLAESLNAALRHNGLPERTTEEVRGFVGNGIRRLIERGVPKGTQPEMVDAVQRSFREHYRVHCAERTRPYEGIPELLRALRSRGIRIAVVSNKDDGAVQTLCSHYFPGLVDLALGARAEIRKKPMPDAVNLVIENLGVDRRFCVCVGDSEVDLQTAEHARIPCLSVGWGFKDASFLRDNGAAQVCESPKQLQHLLCP